MNRLFTRIVCLCSVAGGTLLFGSGGCGGGVDQGKVFNNAMQKYSSLRTTINIGDDKNEVIGKLEKLKMTHKRFNNWGDREMLSKTMKDGSVVDVYFMRTNWYSDGLQTDDEYTPYVFIDGKLAAVGWEVLGGQRTKHDERLVRENEERARQAAIMGAMMYLNMGNQMQQLGRNIQNASTPSTTVSPGKSVGGIQLAPDGSWVGGKPQLAPDGSWVGGKPQLAPNGKWVGVPEN